MRVTASVSADSALLEVRDDGPGIAEADRERVFERFVRLDEARDRGEGGFGLGLSIVATLCRAYGGSIEVHRGNPGAVFEARFPLATCPDAVASSWEPPSSAQEVGPLEPFGDDSRSMVAVAAVKGSGAHSTGAERSPTAR